MILLTGAGGFIGKQFIEFILNQYPKTKLVAVTNSKIKNVHCVSHDDYIYDQSSFPKSIIDSIEVIVHLGAFIPKSGTESNDFIKCNGNINSTESLLKLKWPSLKKFIFISSIDVYGNNNHIIDELSTTLPSTLYGWSKLYCEKMIQSHCDILNIETVILRLGHVYGPGEEFYQKLIPVTMKRLITGQSPIVLGDGGDLRSFIYVGDVVRVIISAIQKSISSCIINVVHHQSYSILNVVEKIIAVSKKNISIEFKEGSFQKRNLVFDNSRLKKELCSSLTNFDDGLYIEWKHISGNE